MASGTKNPLRYASIMAVTVRKRTHPFVPAGTKHAMIIYSVTRTDTASPNNDPVAVMWI